MTIYDIALEAGVSITTVSRVINNPQMVSAATREHVKKILEEHNFIPNDMARGLVHKSMKTVGIMMNDILHQHFLTIAYVLERMFFSWGYSTLLCNTGDDELEKKEKYMRALSSKKIDGLVLIGSLLSGSDFEALLEAYFPTTPIITSAATINLRNAYSVQVDHEYGIERAIAHLMEKGHANICFVYCRDSYNTKRKIISFKQVMQAKGLQINDDDNLMLSGSGPQGGIDFAGQAIKSGQEYTAYIFADDVVAVGAVNGFRRNGFQVPDDIAVIGYDNTDYALCSTPLLTSIDTMAQSMSTVMANTLHDIFQGREVGNSILIRPELVVREST